MTAARSWKETLRDRMPEALAREIDIFETQIELKKVGKITDKLFAETRLRRGVYGQRYDNGRRHDGATTQTLNYPCGDLTKGPETVWDAPGMMRIKIPLGKVTPAQLDLMCELAEEYSDQILHVTTRQDIQLHFIHIDDTPDLMRRLASVGITTREACGNSVRNVTACQYAGVCSEQTFDVTPYAHAATMFLLGHDDVQDFGRKLKPAFSGCKDNPCGLTTFHDIGCIAQVREIDGKPKRGFEVYVGGGLGAVPHPAKLLEEFTPEEELLPMMQAVCRVFARLGEKENRSRARLKFLVNKLGIEEFARLVKQERAQLRPDPRWTSYLEDLAALDEKPLKPGSELGAGGSERFKAWYKTNVRPQAQPGYSCAIVTLPLGDFTPDQGRIMSDLAREFTDCSLRFTVDQNMLFRWVSNGDLPELFARLDAAGLGASGAETISDITSCPGTDTCKLGISSSRGLAGELRRQLSLAPDLPPAAQALHIKCSGCFNSCGQHHVADIGFLGVSRNVSGRRVPHFQLVVGGQWTENAKTYGLAIGAIPSKHVPQAVDRLTRAYAEGRREGETYREYVARVGKKAVRQLIDDLTQVPTYDTDPSFYSDWGDPREFTIGDMGVGECAGEIVPFVEVGLAASERELFEAQVILDEEGNAPKAAERAYQAMLHAAKALTRERNANLGDDPDEIVREFKLHLCDTRLFHDPYVGDKFANFLFSAHGNGTAPSSNATAHQRIEEAQLFVEAAHQCYIRNASPAS
ncbi:MAG TPA: nitrite/sulfite reductase [Polyangiaceae bacterium]|nr:nitrite/sulfite reductase [Polyangiaceae bacterium]